MTDDRHTPIPRRALHLSLREDKGRMLTDLAYDAHATLSDVVEALVSEVALADEDVYRRSVTLVREYVEERTTAERLRDAKKGAA